MLFTFLRRTGFAATLLLFAALFTDANASVQFDQIHQVKASSVTDANTTQTPEFEQDPDIEVATSSHTCISAYWRSANCSRGTRQISVVYNSAHPVRAPPNI